MKIEEDGSDLITLPRVCNQSASCILYQLKLFMTFLGTLYSREFQGSSLEVTKA